MKMQPARRSRCLRLGKGRSVFAPGVLVALIASSACSSGLDGEEAPLLEDVESTASGGKAATGGEPAGTGGEPAGTGGELAGTGGELAGTGGEPAGVGGSATGTGSTGSGGGETLDTDPMCERGIMDDSGNVCCAASCGECGGEECGAREGGADSCCTGAIIESGVSCGSANAPCIVNDVTAAGGSPGTGGNAGTGGGGGSPMPVDCNGARYHDKNGVVIIDPETTSLKSSWQKEDDGYGSGNIVWGGADSFNDPGKGVLTFKVKVAKTGTYGLTFRSRAGGSSKTEENDTWLKIEGTNQCGVYGLGDDGEKKWANGCGACGEIVDGTSKDCWYKIYVNNTSWNWRARTSDNDARTIHANFTKAGVYTLRLSARSKGHHVDRIVMWHTGSREESDAQGASLGETICR